MAAIERPVVSRRSATPRRRRRIAVIAILALISTGVLVTWPMLRGGDEATPIGTVQRLGSAMRSYDLDTVNDLLGRTGDRAVDQQFGDAIVWSTALEAEPTLLDCTSLAYGTRAEDKVTCTLAFGDDFFYSQILGEALTSMFSAYVLDGRIAIVDFGTPVGTTPNGVLEAEAEFQEWVRENRFDLHDELRFVEMRYLEDAEDSGRRPAIDWIAGDFESGQLRMTLLGEFMASRG